jgi:hypothetical protein
MTKTLHLFYSKSDVSAVLPSSILLTSINHDLNLQEYHTSIGDLSAAEIIKLSKNFDEINLLDINFDKKSAEWRELKILLNYLSHTHTVHNFECQAPPTFLSNQKINRHSSEPMLWIFGCSHSHGVGLFPGESKFGDILGKELNLPTRFITSPGSSLHWSLRHLINSEIKPQDTVIWQLTTPERITVYNQSVAEVMLARTTNPHLLNVYSDQQIYFQQCNLINYGVQYLRSLKTKFAMTSILQLCDLYHEYLSVYTSYPEYCYSPGIGLDLGHDNQHMGPLSHQALAFSLLDHVQCTNE